MSSYLNLVWLWLWKKPECRTCREPNPPKEGLCPKPPKNPNTTPGLDYIKPFMETTDTLIFAVQILSKESHVEWPECIQYVVFSSHQTLRWLSALFPHMSEAYLPSVFVFLENIVILVLFFGLFLSSLQIWEVCVGAVQLSHCQSTCISQKQTHFF